MSTNPTPGPLLDHRSVEELVRDSDVLARDLLFDHDADHYERLRTFGEVVESALDLWNAIPSRLRDERLDTIHASTISMHRSIASDPTWPGIGSADPTMGQISGNLSRAAELISTRRLQGIDLSAAGQRAAEGIRVRILHTLFISAHATLVAAQSHLRQIDSRQQRTDLAHTRAHQSAAHTRAHQSAAHTRDKVAAIEYDLSLLTDMTWPHVLTGQDPPAPPEPSRIEAAIARWDLQAHRSLASDPSLATLVSVADSHRNLTFLTTLVTAAAAEAGVVGRDEFRTRLLPAFDNLQNAWGNVAADLARFLGANRSVDPQLRQADTELKAASREISHDHTSLATPAHIAARVDLPAAINSLQRSISVGVNLAYVIREAIEHRTPTVAARPALEHSMATAALVPAEGWVNARDLHHNHNVTMPTPVRTHLIDTATHLINAAVTADSASASISTIARSSAGHPAKSGSAHHDREHPPSRTPPPRPGPIR